MKSFVLIFIILYSLMPIFSTEIFGVIEEDTTIGPEGNPWYVTHDLDVSEGVTLSILPGTEIFVTSVYSDDFWNFVADTSGEAPAKVITVYGNIIALGTESDSILFTRYPDYPDFRWGGIRIVSENPEESYFKYCILEYSAVYHDNISFPSGGIVSNVGLNIEYSRFIDNYFGIYLVDRIESEYPSNINYCSFDNTTDCYLYYGESDCSIGISGTNDIIPIVVSRCGFTNIGIDLDGYNSVVHCNFENINYNFHVSKNLDFYGNQLSDSERNFNYVYGIEDHDGVFRKNTFNDINDDLQFFFEVQGYGYKDISDNYFNHSDIKFDLKPDSKFYNNVAEYCELRSYCDYDEAGSQNINNNYIFETSFSFRGHGDCNFFNNVIYGEDSGSAITLLDENDDFYGFNNYCDQWSLRASYLTEGEAVNYYNNIFNDWENFVENHSFRYNRNFYNNFLTYEIPEFIVDCGGNLEGMDIELAGVIIDTLNHTFALADSSLCIDAGYADTTFCAFDYSYNFSPFDGDGDGVAVVDIGPVEYGSYFTVGYVECMVTDMDGLPLDVIRGAVEGQSVEYTGLDGNFVMALPVGTYNLVLDSPFYERDSIFVAVNVADTSYVSMSLEESYPVVNNDEHEVIENGKLKIENYPNPFNPETKIAYSLPEKSDVKISVYNIKGQLVKLLNQESEEAGEHFVIWDGVDNQNRSCASGIYFCRISAGSQVKTQKMLLLK